MERLANLSKMKKAMSMKRRVSMWSTSTMMEEIKVQGSGEEASSANMVLVAGKGGQV